MHRELTAWSTRPLAAKGELVELTDQHGRRIVVIARREGRLLADLHNRVIDDAHAAIAAARDGAERATLGDVEALLVRVLVAALKELARGVLPRRLRGRTPVHTGG
jgi:DNA-directed RNA polymerase subunit K/omega